MGDTNKPSRFRLAVRRMRLLPAVVLTVLGLAVAGVVVWGLFTRLLRGDWPWDVGALDESTPGKDTTQIVLTVIAGLGAGVALVVAYRRQRDAELARFDERFAAAAAQLGAPTAAERLAGVYAMAALADAWEQHRQQCIDVLCGYLRLPYSPSAGLLKTVAVERTLPALDEGEPEKETRTYEHLPNDREVRLTIISTVTRHLRDTAPISWKGHDLDFTGATFDGGDFSGATFTGTVNFAEATFASGTINFSTSTFSSGTANFIAAAFAGGTVDFTSAAFTGGTVNFIAAAFRSSDVTFYKARFAGGTVDFTAAGFVGGTVNFTSARFAGSDLSFERAAFAGGTVAFNSATFDSGTVTFTDAVFAGGRVARDGAEFRGWPTPEPDPEPAGPVAG